jgi:glucosamine--fructose-6-phosphate aminotransferase (isomerizing)
MFDGLIPQEIFDTPQAIQATVKDARPQAYRAAEAMRERRPRRVFLIGNGTSLYSSMAASYTARLLADPDDPFVVVFPAGDFRFLGPRLDSRDVVVGISASGEFRDVLAIFEELRGKSLCIGITHVPGSSITQLADATILSSGGPSRVPVMTKTYASTLTAAHLLMLEYFQADEAYYGDLLASADRCLRAIRDAEQTLDKCVPILATFEHGFYFGAGCGHAAALEAALKMKEMALFHAEASETWEMASGPATRVAADTVCVGLQTGHSTDVATTDGLRHAQEWGACTVEVGPARHLSSWHLPVEAPWCPAFASLALVPPLSLLAYRVARKRGTTPDRPEWRDRYLSQGMKHILGEEDSRKALPNP